MESCHIKIMLNVFAVERQKRTPFRRTPRVALVNGWYLEWLSGHEHSSYFLSPSSPELPFHSVRPLQGQQSWCQCTAAAKEVRPALQTDEKHLVLIQLLQPPPKTHQPPIDAAAQF